MASNFHPGFLGRLALITLMWTTMARSMAMNYGHSVVGSTGFTWVSRYM